ncbi:MAG: cytochrome c biogenesis CcdA family protein [Nocardioides sp.]
MPDGLLALALGAGMLAAVNPCGFALLPAYLSLLIAADESTTRSGAVFRALKLTAAMSLGFAAVFAAFGLAILPIASGVQRHLPWFTLVLGLVLVALGALLLAGRSVSLPRWGRTRREAKPLTGGWWSMTGFGAGYALASLTCTIAPFLAIVVAGFRTESLGTGLALFAAYAVGMGLIVGTVAIAIALARATVIARLRRSGRWAGRVGGLVLLLSGAYVAYYGWWETRVLAGGSARDPVIDAAVGWQRALSELVQQVPPWGWAALAFGLLAIGVLGQGRRLRH